MGEGRSQLAVLSSRLNCLAAGREPAYVRYRQAQILMRIDGSVVDADFVVEVGTSAASALADVSDRVSAVYVLAGDAGEAAQVTIANCGNAVAVVHNHGASVAAHEVGKHDHAISGRKYGLAVVGSDINTTVESALPR